LGSEEFWRATDLLSQRPTTRAVCDENTTETAAMFAISHATARIERSRLVRTCAQTHALSGTAGVCWQQLAIDLARCLPYCSRACFPLDYFPAGLRCWQRVSAYLAPRTGLPKL